MDVSNSNQQRTIYISIFVDSVQVVESERRFEVFKANSIYAFETLDLLTVNGSQSVDVQWKTESNTATSYNKTLILIKVST